MKPTLNPDRFYHIYNHANGRENLFENSGNYRYFIKRYVHFIHPIAETYAYCLMPNHFHFAIKIKALEEIVKVIRMQQSSKGLEPLDDYDINNDLISKFLSRQFANLFNSYAQAFNKQQNRKGSLFIPNFSRKLVDSEEYLRTLIHYIHLNPVHHGFVYDFTKWKHSSYITFISTLPTEIKRYEVITMFSGKENFIAYHRRDIDNNMISDLEE